MRLFAKFFLWATLVISAALLFSGYLLITNPHENAVGRERDRALNQYQYDKFTIQAELITNAASLQNGIYGGMLNRLASDLSGSVAFFDGDKTLLYSDLPSQTDFAMLGDISDNTVADRIQTINEKSYVVVGGKLTQSGVTLYLLIATDISPVVAQKELMAQSFIKVYFITLAVSMSIILLLSALMTRPIKRLGRAAAEIAGGNYRERIPISSGDEIGDLSKSFNLMADAVEDKINALAANARQKEDFVASFAHELKTPLTAVIGYADLLYQKTLPPEQAKDAAGYILSEGLRLEALSLKLMDLIVLNRQDFTLEVLPSTALFQNVAGGLNPLLEEKKVSLHLKVSSAYIKVEYDLFKTLVLNLIDNAIKAGADDIEVIGKQSGNRYCVSVSDNGRGMPASELDRITEAFYRVDRSRSRKQHGAGLGLALASRLAGIHGGALHFESEEGTGTIVTFDLASAEGDENA
ncbi:MAG: HAMP domain-containing histidine kinase [Oscillospiraceae bacterium]|jgi:signal transduction histidine kinase|nr:HAMP domain-containing histidine kinase [Oscillospiraceae bacterium]